MAQLRGTQNYIWDTLDVLGQGATAAVYRARHKRTGDLFAVKTFNQMSQMRSRDVQMREFDVMLKLDHDNIVKLLAIEEEVNTRSRVIVMELCTGGSLYNILDDPENAYGLEEKEFFKVVQDVTGGMKHIRDQGIVHRDIKPGNIMRFISEDGRAIYKLTDFGAARELEEEEQFMSLYGTEEYLHPDLYERAVLRRPMAGHFTATVDLWSLGVTFYHVAAGQLPFRPFGGRRNRETMYMITTEKESGVISGLQHSENGPIEWSRDLPRHCKLSRGARRVMVPLLAGLMECVQSRMWTFDQFFEAVHHVVRKHWVHVFSTATASLLCVPLDATEKYAKLCERIASQTDIPASQQILLYNNSPLLQHVTPLMEFRSYPKTSPSNPILLYRQEPSDCDRCVFYEIPPFQQFSSQVSLDSDFHVAKSTCGLLFLIQRYVSQITDAQQFFNIAVKAYLFVLKHDIDSVRQHVSQFEVVCRETHHRITYFVDSHQTQRHLVNILLEHIQEAPPGENKAKIGQFLNQLEQLTMDHQAATEEVCKGVQGMRAYVDDYYSRIVVKNDLNSAWKDTTENMETDRFVQRLEGPLKTARGIVSSFRRSRSAKRLGFNEEQIHNFDKTKMSDIRTHANSIFDCCTHNLAQDYTEFTKWFRTASTVRTKLNRLQSQVRAFAEQHTAAAEQLDRAMEDHYRMMGELVSQLQSKQIDVRKFSVTQGTSGSISSKSAGVMTSSVTMTTNSTSTQTVDATPAPPPPPTPPTDVGTATAPSTEKTRKHSPVPPERPPRGKFSQYNKTLLQQLNKNLSSLKDESSAVKTAVLENSELLKQLEELSFQSGLISTELETIQ